MTLRLRPDVSTADTDYGTVLLDGADGRYWQLNGSASVALRVLLEGGTVEQAVQRLLATYDVDEPRARADVERLLAKLAGAKLVLR
ncbi:lasso peptide biosynthesis PqqD family chaperone [Streptomyces orinoci]|uniref:Lasso peptide biosynthesis PqqD family chaperone n=1 Tax=Streptomyces orinoci TaxID=67339 RepID=A0ABV3JXU1_STRON|nr:lasso peptide biosynthesis PqqD family chaperone [Streptomyces orinoci]